jgi:hypothetical protein
MRIAAAAMPIPLAIVPAAAQSNPPPGVYPFPPPSPPIMTSPGGRDLPVRIDPIDKATRCLQYAASIGVPRDRLKSYLRDCQMR